MHLCASLLRFHEHLKSYRKETDLLKQFCRFRKDLAIVFGRDNE